MDMRHGCVWQRVWRHGRDVPSMYATNVENPKPEVPALKGVTTRVNARKVCD